MNAPSIALHAKNNVMGTATQQVIIKNNDWMLYAALFFCSAPPVLGFVWIMAGLISCFL